MTYEAIALLAALSVAFSNLISPPAIRHLGPVVFNCWRLGAALLALVTLASLQGAWIWPSTPDVLALASSSFVGIFAGDTCVYAAMARIGPRRTAVLYTSGAPFAAVLAYVVLGETLSITKIVGIATGVIGIGVAIIYRDAENAYAWDEVRGPLWLGALFGLLGGLGAAGAVLVAKPVMAAGVDPAAAAAAIRAAVGLLGLLGLSQVPAFRAHQRATGAVVLRSAASGLLRMGVGMTLVLVALSHLPTGVAATLSAMTPILLLPLLWLFSGQRPASLAWVGAILAVVGVAAISSGS